MSIEEIKKIPFFFIVGAGRSGTTLLRTVFDAHPHVCIPVEGKTILHLKMKYFHQKFWNEKRIQEMLDDLYFDRKFKVLWRVNREKLTHALLSLPLDELDFPTLCKVIYLEYTSLFTKEKILLIGDKNPIYSMCLSELREVFPSAKFVHLVRDYRDVIASNLKHFKRKDVAVLSQYWKQHNAWIEKAKCEIPQQFLTIRYEELVADPTATSRIICNFLEIPFKEQMLNYHLELKKIYQPEEHLVFARMFPDLVRPITAENSNKWKGKFNDQELEMMYSILHQDGLKYGYKADRQVFENKYTLASKRGFFINIMDVIVIKNYYLVPLFVRKFIRKLSDLLFYKAGYSTVYNEEMNQIGIKLKEPV